MLDDVAVQEFPGQQPDIVSSLAQRGDVDDDYGEPKIEVFPERAGLDRLLKVSVGRSNDACVTRDLLARPDPLKALLLQKPQQLHLHARWQLANLVEKERPARGRLDVALPHARGRR